MDWKNMYIEETTSERAQFLWVSLFYYMCKICKEDYGIEGERTIRKAVRDFGRERGIRRRQRANAMGLDIDILTLKRGVRDILSDPRFSKPSTREIPRVDLLEPEHNFTKVYSCPNANIWAQLEGKQLGEYLDIGSIYCEEVHHNLYGDFDPAVQVNLCEILTKGDDCCNFRIHLRKANQSKYEVGEYKKEKWEYTEDDVTDSIYTMFALHLYHYSNAVYKDFGEQQLRKILHAWAKERGNRLRELNRRKNRPCNIDTLVLEGDLFLDSRSKKEIKEIGVDHATVLLHRCIVSELLQDHDAQQLSNIYYEELYKGVCETYNPRIKAESKKHLDDGKERYLITFKM